MPIDEINLHKNKSNLYLKQQQRESRFPLNIADRRTDGGYFKFKSSFATKKRQRESCEGGDTSDKLEIRIRKHQETLYSNF